jgi:hypothetical protein
MSDEVMRLAQQFLAREAADFNEGRIAVDDPALDIRHRNERLTLGKREFAVDDRKVESHVDLW